MTTKMQMPQTFLHANAIFDKHVVDPIHNKISPDATDEYQFITKKDCYKQQFYASFLCIDNHKHSKLNSPLCDSLTRQTRVKWFFVNFLNYFRNLAKIRRHFWIEFIFRYTQKKKIYSPKKQWIEVYLKKCPWIINE